MARPLPRSTARDQKTTFSEPGISVTTLFRTDSLARPSKGEERSGSRSSVYRFHLDSPVPFTKSIRATIEHGHANHRSDNYYSVAYWYQSEPHATFPPLAPAEARIPKLQPVGGPGNAGAVR